MSFPELDERRAAALEALRVAMDGPPAKVAALLGVKGEALVAAVAANRHAATAPTLPAIERYTGVLYDALDAASLPARERRRLRAQAVILSGLWGLVQPGDPIPGYKLKMGATLTPMGRLSTWWRPAVTAALAPRVQGRTVWDLLPGEHSAAWAPAAASDGGPSAIFSVRFLDEKPRPRGRGERRFTTVSHWNKLLKGALVRHVLTHQLTDPAGLGRFEHPEGYVYDPGLTEVHGDRVQLVMVRPAP